jgi:hypothetical protein
MLSTLDFNDSTKAHDGNRLRSKVSEQSIELSTWSEDDKQALVLSPATKPWKPLTHKAYFLLPTILVSGALVAVLQIYLERSHRDTGILFASSINDLPLNQKFPYLYLPTIVSLVLSFAWAWLDLDVRRLQPFIELSKKRGARGADSLLLHYPFDFVAFVPFTAAKRRYDLSSPASNLAKSIQPLASLLGVPSSCGDILGTDSFAIKYLRHENDPKGCFGHHSEINILSLVARAEDQFDC